MAYPVPSVPTAGKLSPPMARMTTGTCSSTPFLMRSAHAAPLSIGRRLSTLVSYRISTPTRRHACISLSRTSRELLLNGKYLFVTCSMPSSNCTSCSSHSRHRATVQEASTAFTSLGLLSVTKSWAVADTGRTLHRAPPLMRIFFPVSLVRSYIVTRAPVVAAKYAAVSPAAPPPSTATSVELLLLAKGPLADEACERDPSPGDDVVCSAAVLLLLAMLMLRPVEDALRSRNRKRTIR
mmetsp:Transcript_22360/g.36067  ORF Transcript_22360/g.36067 Transcript_22360/m.36067 type:complete len:238 (-) Transcript_22360:126-839(-)